MAPITTGLPKKKYNSVPRVQARVSKEMYARLFKCAKFKGIKENAIIITALDEYLLKNGF